MLFCVQGAILLPVAMVGALLHLIGCDMVAAAARGRRGREGSMGA